MKMELPIYNEGLELERKLFVEELFYFRFDGWGNGSAFECKITVATPLNFNVIVKYC